MTRRELLRAAGIATGALVLPWPVRGATPAAADRGSSVLIVGGGLAGLVLAHRLSEAGVAVELFEASDRLGGRVFTQRGFNGEGMFCDLGAELVDTNQAPLLTLARQLGVKVEEVDEEEDDASPVYYFGGQVRTEKELLTAVKPFAERVAKDAVGALGPSGKGIYFEQPTETARRLDAISLSRYLDDANDVEKWVRGLVATAYTGEYGLEPNDQSALNLVTLFGTDLSSEFEMYGESDEALRIVGGSSSLVEALRVRLEKRATIHYGHELRAIRERARKLELIFRVAGRNRSLERKCDAAALALPLAVLRAKVDGWRKLSLSPDVKRSIGELGVGANTKLMIGYTSRAWREGDSPRSGEAYTDLASQCFWETSRAQKGKSGILTNFLGGKTAAAISQPFDRAVADALTLFPPTKGKTDGARATYHWPTGPFAMGSYTCPKPGQFTTMLGRFEPELLGGKLYLIGEHSSREGFGYMNGAIESGERVAKAMLSVTGVARRRSG